MPIEKCPECGKKVKSFRNADGRNGVNIHHICQNCEWDKWENED